MTRLSVSTLHHAYGPQPVLRGLSLEVPPGAVTAILGASGSGKTTLLRVIAGFERARNGIVRLGETTVDDGRQFVPPHRRRIGYVPQDGALFPHLSVLANIGFGLPRRGRAARARVLADLVGLADLVRRRPHELSGGQQRRVALARALAIRPDLVLL
ncbi:MAG TPA: ATP-binding cassette domain-containing protein, partial [Streptosporangiaceae bacterium]|nr:ATP-binding cassette domain-containing protein [Streptosporangiaceae bacterium]